MTIDDLPDLTRIIREASHDPRLRRIASRHLHDLLGEEDPLGRDHGTYHPRMSDFGDCSLRYVAANLNLLDVDRPDDSQWILDNGTLMGAWWASLLKAGAENLEDVSQRFLVSLEVVLEYDGVPGHADAMLDLPCGWVPAEFKSTPSTSQLKAPDVRKLYQALQACGYSGGAPPSPSYFGIVSAGYNVSDDKHGNPHPKMRHDWYVAKDFLPLVDEEIKRLRTLGLISLEHLEDQEIFAGLADNRAFCGSCRFSRCDFNKNPMRLAF